MGIEKTVSELAEILGVSRQAVNNRIKSLPEEDLEKNAKGVTVINRSGLLKLEEMYHKTIIEEEPVNEDKQQRELLEVLVEEKNTEISRLYEQLQTKDAQIAEKDKQLEVKDTQIAEKDKQLDQQQQLTLQAMKEQEKLQLELDAAKLQIEEVSGVEKATNHKELIDELKSQVTEMKAQVEEASNDKEKDEHKELINQLQAQVTEMKSQVNEKKGFFARLFGK